MINCWQQNSAARNGGSKDVWIFSVIVAELKFRHVERQILAADLVERAHDPALQDREIAFNCVRVSLAAHIFADSVIRDVPLTNGGNA